MKEIKTSLHIYLAKKGSFLVLYLDEEATRMDEAGEDWSKILVDSYFVEFPNAACQDVYDSDINHVVISLINGRPVSVALA